MAEAAVEERPTNSRFFCHKCTVEFDHVSPEYTCPHCLGGFIEELENNTEGSDEPIIADEDDEEEYTPPWMDSFNALLMDIEPRAGTRARFVHDPSRRRRYATTQPRFRIGRPRTLTTRISDGRQQTRFENALQDFILNLGWGGLNQVTGNMLFLSNPGDYAWGREGLDAIVTQLLNQMDGTGPPPLSKELIQNIPTVPITQEQVDAKVQCSVCWEDFILDENVRKLPCQHVYHENCICPWLELHGTCPICRQNLAPGNDSAPNTEGRNNATAGNFASFQDFLQAVQENGSDRTSSSSSESSSAATSSDSTSTSTNTVASDRCTIGSSSSDCNTDLESN